MLWVFGVKWLRNHKWQQSLGGLAETGPSPLPSSVSTYFLTSSQVCGRVRCPAAVRPHLSGLRILVVKVCMERMGLPMPRKHSEHPPGLQLNIQLPARQAGSLFVPSRPPETLLQFKTAARHTSGRHRFFRLRGEFASGRTVAC